MEILDEIKDMDAEDVAQLLRVFDRENPTLDDLLFADSQRKKKSRQINIYSLHNGINAINY